MTPIVIGIAAFVVLRLVDIATKERLAYWQRQYVEAKERQVEGPMSDSSLFDTTLHWAYLRGYEDGRNKADASLGMKAIVIEHRTEFPNLSP